MKLQEYAVQLFVYRWELFFLVMFIWHHRTLYKEWLFNPIAGGNGKIQMDELSKAIILLYAYRALELEGKSVDQVYPDVFWFSIFFSIAAIAGIKHYASNYKKSFSNSHSGSTYGSRSDAADSGARQEAG
jgi:hypothetical protein